MGNEEQDLIPLGKMKGEMDGEFEAFYLAFDMAGQLYINYSPSYSKEMYCKSNGWLQITRRQLEQYEKQLHFFPTRKNQLKV